jgi:hypothetical protein
MEREIWTQRSTGGYSNAELAKLRKAQRTLEKAYPHKTRTEIQEAIHDAYDLSPMRRTFAEGFTAEHIIAAVTTL